MIFATVTVSFQSNQRCVMNLAVQDLSQVFAVLTPRLTVQQVTNHPNVYTELDENYAGFKNHVLIAIHDFSGDWPSWESHPAGDETVVLLSGCCEFVLQVDNHQQCLRLNQAGDYVVVPKGVWHTAKISQSAKLLFITPGENTQNSELPA